MEKSDSILRRIIDVVDKTVPNSEVYLYGSRARGTAKKDSDWDLLILLNNQFVSFDFETKVMDSFYDLEIETGEVVSPLIYSKKDWIVKHTATPLFKNISQEGIRLK